MALIQPHPFKIVRQEDVVGKLLVFFDLVGFDDFLNRTRGFLAPGAMNAPSSPRGLRLARRYNREISFEQSAPQFLNKIEH